MRNMRYKFLMLAATGLTCMSIPAFAGFQFNAPPAPTPIQAQSVMGQSEQAPDAFLPNRLLPVLSEDIPAQTTSMKPVMVEQKADIPVAPVIQWSDEAVSTPPVAVSGNSELDYLPSIYDEPYANKAMKPVSPQVNQAHARPSAPTANPVVISNAPSSPVYGMAVGFGKDLPLVSALRQIVPPDYTFVLDEGVKAGQEVSWNGGREWPVVLNETLSPMGLSSSLDGKIVRIHGAGVAAGQQSPVQIAPSPMVAVPSAPDSRLLGEFSLDPSVGIKLTPSLPKQAMAETQMNDSNAPVVSMPDAQNNKPMMDQLYIAQSQRRPQILTQPTYELDAAQPFNTPLAKSRASSLDSNRRVPPIDSGRPVAQAPAAVPAVQPEPLDVVETSFVEQEPLPAMNPAVLAEPTPVAQISAEPDVIVQPKQHVQVVTSRPIDILQSSKVAVAPIVAPTPAPKMPEPALSSPVVSEPVASAPLAVFEPVILAANNSPAMAMTPHVPDAPQVKEAPAAVGGQWFAQSGTSLKTILESWADLEGVDLFWSSDYDFVLAGDVNITGTFDEAVTKLLEGFSGARPKPMGRLHPNLPNGPAVLVIETRQSIE